MESSYSAIIVDDEIPSREILKDLLLKYCPEVEVIDTAETADKAKILIDELKPNVVFLDIHMPGKSGFDLLDSFSEINFEIIFTTAFDDYAVKAFRLSAIDYLLKPINIKELQQAVKRLDLKSISKSHNRYDALKNFYTQQNPLDKLMLPTANGYSFVKIEDIIYIEAQSNYTEFYFTNRNPIIVCKTMVEYEQILCNFLFHRIHHKYLINLRLIDYFNSKENYVIMVNGIKLLISLRKKVDFVKRFKPY